MARQHTAKYGDDLSCRYSLNVGGRRSAHRSPLLPCQTTDAPPPVRSAPRRAPRRSPSSRGCDGIQCRFVVSPSRQSLHQLCQSFHITNRKQRCLSVPREHIAIAGTIRSDHAAVAGDGLEHQIRHPFPPARRNQDLSAGHIDARIRNGSWTLDKDLFRADKRINYIRDRNCLCKSCISLACRYFGMSAGLREHPNVIH